MSCRALYHNSPILFQERLRMDLMPFGENGGSKDKEGALGAHETKRKSLRNRPPCPREGQSPLALPAAAIVTRMGEDTRRRGRVEERAWMPNQKKHTRSAKVGQDLRQGRNAHCSPPCARSMLRVAKQPSSQSVSALHLSNAYCCHAHIGRNGGLFVSMLVQGPRCGFRQVRLPPRLRGRTASVARHVISDRDAKPVSRIPAIPEKLDFWRDARDALAETAPSPARRELVSSLCGDS